MTSTPRPPLRAVRLLREGDAALYCGVSPTKFRALIKDERLPPARPIDGCSVWDVRELDPAIDALLYGEVAQSEGGGDWD